VNTTGWLKGLQVTAGGTGVVSHAGVALVRALSDAVGLTGGLSQALASGRLLAHDRGRVLADLACAIADGGEAISDFRVIGDQGELFGPVASVPTVWRTLSEIAAGGAKTAGRVTAAVNAARRTAWAGIAARHGALLGVRVADKVLEGVTCVRLDASVVTCHSPALGHAHLEEDVRIPLTVFADHGPVGSGEPLTVLLRPGNAGSNTASEHIDATTLALAQLPRHLRRRVLIRADSGGGTHDFLKWLAKPGRRLAYSAGFTITDDTQDAILAIPAQAWTPAYDAGRQVRPGARVAELTGMLDLSSWPKGMRVIVRKERPHPGAQLRFTDIDGHRFTCFATSTKGGQLADLELRHRRRARCEDRIRCAKDTGLRNLPLHGYDQNKIWCEIVTLACELLAWTQMLALTGPARRWEPRRLRLRIFSAAGRIVRGSRRLRLRLAARWPWASQITAGITRIQALAPG